MIIAKTNLIRDDWLSGNGCFGERKVSDKFNAILNNDKNNHDNSPLIV